MRTGGVGGERKGRDRDEEEMISMEGKKRKTSEGGHAMEGKAKETRQKRKFERNEEGRREDRVQQQTE